jgi:hypothetical protein
MPTQPSVISWSLRAPFIELTRMQYAVQSADLILEELAAACHVDNHDNIA